MRKDSTIPSRHRKKQKKRNPLVDSNFATEAMAKQGINFGILYIFNVVG